MYETRSSRKTLIKKEKKNVEDNEEDKPLNDDKTKKSLTSHSPQRVTIYPFSLLKYEL